MKTTNISTLLLLASATAERHLQNSLTCLISGGDPSTCCANASDQVCSVINCADLSTGSFLDSCKCSVLVDFCDNTAQFLAATFPDVGTLCDAANGCCTSGNSTDTTDFNTCLKSSNVDISSLLGLLGESGSGNSTGNGTEVDMGMDMEMSMPASDGVQSMSMGGEMMPGLTSSPTEGISTASPSAAPETVTSPSSTGAMFGGIDLVVSAVTGVMLLF